MRRGVLIAEVDLAERRLSRTARGINTLTGADQVAPYGGAAFHDNRVALERVGPELPGELRPAERREPALA